MPNAAHDEGISQAVLQAIGQRLKTYLDEEWRGNQSTLAKQLRLSQPAISRVIAGEQLPSGKLLLALRLHTNLDLDWLLCEQGEMLLRSEAELQQIACAYVPVANQPLPGPPEDHPAHLSGDRLPGYGTVTRSQYWLRIHKQDPITQDALQRIKGGDLILLETDRQLFPDAERIWDELWVIRLKTRDQFRYRLAEVNHREGDWFTVDPFDAEPERREQEKVIELRELPGGRYEGSAKKRPKQGKLSPRRPEVIPTQHHIKGGDLVARKIVLLRP